MLISIADVGVGISQILPVLVALIAAEKGQAAYIEKPEMHLRPLACQVAPPPVSWRTQRSGVCKSSSRRTVRCSCRG